MDDSELKSLLVETCPVRPGQESRAWAALRDRLYQSSPASSRWAWLYYPTWRGAVVGLATVCALAFLGNVVLVHFQPVSFASADSESPGIYATSFYSNSAKAQVVWLNGLQPATDQRTDLPLPTGVPSQPKKPKPAGDPTSL